MAKRSQIFQVFPWVGGINTALDSSLIPTNEVVIGDNILSGVQMSKKRREGINYDFDDASNSTASIIGGHDFWHGSTSRAQKYIQVTNAGGVFSTDSGGTRTVLTVSGTALTTPATCSMLTFNNLCLIATDGATNILKKYAGSGNVENLGGTPPTGSILQSHLGRVWTNDKTNLDRLHYSTTANPEEWNGTGDSGAIDIGVGDGDREGITAIFPSFKGELFVAKKTKLYRIVGDSPESFQVLEVSNSIGCASHNTVKSIDDKDIVFMSDRGLHSLAAVATYGDFQSSFISAKIQSTFNNDFPKSRLKYAQGAYLASENLYCLAITDESTDPAGTTKNNAVWLYNVETKEWFRWPNVSCESMFVGRDADRERLYFGTSTTRLAKSFNSTRYDVSTSGSETAVIYKIKTGRIFVDGNPLSLKAFKSIGLIYKPVGSHTITVTAKVDKYSSQPIIFTNTSSDALLGVNFILGQSASGSTTPMEPSAYTIDGYGRGIEVSIESSGTDQEVELQGFMIEWEPAEIKQESNLTSGSNDAV